MREATKPVVIVPARLYVPPASTINHVLVPLDGTTAGKRAEAADVFAALPVARQLRKLQVLSRSSSRRTPPSFLPA